MHTDLQIGDRVRLSEIGRKRVRQPERTGVVTAISRSGTQCTVMWEGVRASQVFYFTFLERVPDEAVHPAADQRGSPT